MLAYDCLIEFDDNELTTLAQSSFLILPMVVVAVMKHDAMTPSLLLFSRMLS